MLALLAALILTPKRFLPEPFITAPLQPILPIQALAGNAPSTVARGSFWRPGGLVRLTYYYKFDLGSGPSHRDVMRQGGFGEEVVAYGPQLGERAVRDVDGIQQSVRVIDLPDATYWPWAKLGGPARVVIVTESPYGEPSKWHSARELMDPPLPPGFPPKIHCLESTDILDVRSDPIVPRSFRTTVNVQVRLASRLQPQDLARQILRELPPSLWTSRKFGSHTGIGLRKTAYGLYDIQVSDLEDQTGRFHSQVSLGYLFDDSANAPRLVD